MFAETFSETTNTTSNAAGKNVVDKGDESTNDALKVTLAYERNNGERPWFYMRPLTRHDPHKSPYGGSQLPVETTIRNGRGANLQLDKHSFELVANVSCQLTTRDFYDHPEKISSTYYNEMKDLICRQTGAEKVVVIHHQVRNASRVSSDGAAVQGYANAIHTDSSPHSANVTFRHALDILRREEEATKKKKEEEEKDAESQEATEEKKEEKTAETRDEQEEEEDPTIARYSKGRFLYVNCWRNISDEAPVSNNHLALCDETSLVKPDDYLETDLFGQDFKMEQYRLNGHNAHQHSWYYFPQMTKSEVVLFKQWDSDTQLTGRVCFHTNVADPNASSALPARESIEVRCVAFFPNHTPDTCHYPSSASSLTSPKGVASRMVDAIRGISYWPRTGKLWLVGRVQCEDWSGLADGLLRDPQNFFGVKDANPQIKQKIKDSLLTEVSLEQTAREAAEQCRASLSLTDSVLAQLFSLNPSTAGTIMLTSGVAIMSAIVAGFRKRSA